MSWAYTPEPVVTVLDPQIDLYKRKRYAVLRGPAAAGVSWLQQTATSHSSTVTQWQINPPSPETVMSREMWVEITYTITFTSTDDVNPVLRAGADALRAFPVMSSTSNLQLNLNNQAFTIQADDLIDVFSRFEDGPFQQQTDYSTTPDMLDQSQEYSALFGSVRNPLNPYYDSEQNSRGAFPFDFIEDTSPAPGQRRCVAKLTVYEPVFISPLYWGHRTQTGLCGLTNVQLQFNWGDLNRVWSHDAVHGAPGFAISSVQMIDTPILHMQFLTPPSLFPVPKEFVYPYYEIVRYVTTGNSVAAGALGVITSNNIQLQTIPKRMYVFARRHSADRSYLTTDTFAGADYANPLSINFNNNNGILASANAEDLYAVSIRNGVRESWIQWSGQNTSTYMLSGTDYAKFGTVGSIIALDFGSDIGLPADLAPGSTGTFQLQVKYKFFNPSAAPINYDLYIVVINEGIVTITGDRAIAQIGVISPADVLNAPVSREIDFDHLHNDIYGGGNFFSSLKDFFSKTYGKLKETVPKLIQKGKELYPYAQEALRIGREVAPLLAAGEEEDYGGYGTREGAMRAVRTKAQRGELQSAARKAVATKARRGELQSAARKAVRTKLARGEIRNAPSLHGRGILIGGSQSESDEDNVEDEECEGGQIVDHSDLEHRLFY